MTNERLNLDPLIDWITITQASEILQIHPSQVRRDRSVLSALALIDYSFRSNGFNREAFLIMWRFRELVSQRGRREAIAKIVNLGVGDNE